MTRRGVTAAAGPGAGTWNAVLLAALALYVGACALYALRFGENVTDDAYISYRYADNLLAGHGLVYNPAERVEGYTNFSWILLVAGLMKVGLPPYLASQLLGTLCGALLLISLHRDCRRLWPADSWAPAVVVLGVATSRTFVVWSVSGLETTLFALLLWLGTVSALRADLRRSFPWWAVFAAAAALTRPEGHLWFVLLFGVRAIRALRDGPRELAQLVAPAAVYLALTGGHELFRVTYYGDWVPNTFRAKVAGLRLARGADYLRTLAIENHFYVTMPLVLLGLAGGSLEGSRRLLYAAGLAAFAGYWLAIGGDFLEFRFLAPLLPIWYQAYWAGAAKIFGGPSAASPRRRVLRLVMSALPSLVGVATHVFPFVDTEAVHSIETESIACRRFLQVGRWLAANIAPGESLAIKPAGAIAYVTRVRCLDVLGLNDRDVALHGQRGDGPAGHDVWVSSSYARQRGITYWIGFPDLDLEPIAFSNRVNVVLGRDPDLYFHFLALTDSAKFANGTADYEPKLWSVLR